jgi:hypothetical protein
MAPSLSKLRILGKREAIGEPTIEQIDEADEDEDDDHDDAGVQCVLVSDGTRGGVRAGKSLISSPVCSSIVCILSPGVSSQVSNNEDNRIR